MLDPYLVHTTGYQLCFAGFFWVQGASSCTTYVSQPTTCSQGFHQYNNSRVRYSSQQMHYLCLFRPVYKYPGVHRCLQGWILICKWHIHPGSGEALVLQVTGHVQELRDLDSLYCRYWVKPMWAAIWCLSGVALELWHVVPDIKPLPLPIFQTLLCGVVNLHGLHVFAWIGSLPCRLPWKNCWWTL